MHGLYHANVHAHNKQTEYLKKKTRVVDEEYLPLAGPPHCHLGQPFPIHRLLKEMTSRGHIPSDLTQETYLHTVWNLKGCFGLSAPLLSLLA